MLMKFWCSKYIPIGGSGHNRDDGRFLRCALVEFDSKEAALKALQLKGQLLLGRAVHLGLADDEGTYTPSEGGDRFQNLTILVRGFDTSGGIGEIQSSLKEHFGSCGEITRMSVPKNHDTGAAKGIAYIEFVDNDGFSKARSLDGSEFGGYSRRGKTPRCPPEHKERGTTIAD